MNDDDTTSSTCATTATTCADAKIPEGDDDDDSCQSGIVRIGVKSTTGRKEDKVVHLSINIPNPRRNISVEVPLQKILEDDDDDDDGDKDRSLTFRKLSESVICSRCHTYEDTSSTITNEIKTGLRQLLLSKLLERLAKKTLFRNYEKLIAREVEDLTEVSKNLSITFHSPENLSQTFPIVETSETLCLNQPDLTTITEKDQIKPWREEDQTQVFPNHSSHARENVDGKIFVELAGTHQPIEINHAAFCSQNLRNCTDAATETAHVAEKVDKSTTIHKDESTQTCRLSKTSSNSSCSPSDLEVKYRPKQPSSVSSSCQTDADDFSQVSSSRSVSSKLEMSKHDVIPGQSFISSRRTFEKINGELDESETEEIRTPQTHESNISRKSSFQHDDSTTETESVSSSFMSSVSTSAFPSKPDKTNSNSVMSFGKEVSQVCQSRFISPEEENNLRKLEAKNKNEITNKISKTVTSSKIENLSTKSKESKSNVGDSYLKNIKGTSSQQVFLKESEGDLRRQSKDNQSFISSLTTTKIEQTPPSSTENAQTTQMQKSSLRGRSFSLKPPASETKCLFDFGMDYTKTKQADPPLESNLKMSNSPQSLKDKQVSQSSSKTLQSPSEVSRPKVEVKKSFGNESDVQNFQSATKSSSMKSGRPEDLGQKSISLKLSGDGKLNSQRHLNNNSNKNPSSEVPAEQKERSRLPSSFKNLVSAFETKAKTSEEQHTKRPSFKSSPLK